MENLLSFTLVKNILFELSPLDYVMPKLIRIAIASNSDAVAV